MNKQKPFILLMLCALCATFLTTSCLDTDDDGSGYTTYTRSDSIEQMSAAAGSYSGKMIYKTSATSSTSVKRDSVDCEWTISADYKTYGTFTVADFPVSVLASTMQTSSSTSNAKEIIAAAASQPLSMYIIPYYKQSTTTSTYYAYILYPSAEISFDVEYGGAAHTVTVRLTTSVYDSTIEGYISSVGAKYGSRFEGNICVSSLTIDGQQYSLQTYLYFHN